MGIFLIGILSFIPIESTASLALLFNPKVSGADNVEGFVKPDEPIQLSVMGQLPGNIGLNGRLLMYEAGPNGNPFFCSEVGAFNECRYLASKSELNGNKVFSLPAFLIPPSGPVETISFDGVVDEIPPEITSFSVSPSVIGQGQVSLSFTVEERANSGSSSCSGLKRIKVAHELGDKDFDFFVPDCTIAASIPVDVSQLTSAADGMIALAAVAFDRLNQASQEKTAQFEIDRTPPIVLQDTLQLLDAANKKITFAAGQKAAVSAVINLTEKHPDLAKITADFSSLSVDNAPKQGVCTAVGDAVGCLFSDVVLEISLTNSYPVLVTATDALGNTVSQTVNYPIAFDNAAPVGTGLMTTYHTASGVNFIGAGQNNITLAIREDGAGLSLADVFLDVGEINGSTDIKADQCIKSPAVTGGWECSWLDYVPTKPDGLKQISITSSSKDDLGNPFEPSQPFEVIIDTTPPVIQVMNYTPLFPRSPKPLKINVNITDENEGLLRISASSFSGDTFPKGGTCERVPGTTLQSCIVNVESLVTVPADSSFNVTVIDPAGNKAQAQKSIRLFASEGIGPSECFGAAVKEMIPNKIDRRVGDITQPDPLNVDAYVYLSLQRRDGCEDAEILDMTVECPEAEGNLLSAKPYVDNEFSLNPFIALKLSPAVSSSPADVEIKCNLFLNVKTDTKVFELPEKEEVKPIIRLYNNAFGPTEVNVQKTLDQLKKDIEDTADKIEDYETYMSIFGSWCTIAQIVGQINGLAQTVKATMGAILAAKWTGCASASPVGTACMAAATALWKITCKINSYLHKKVETYIWPSGYPPFITPVKPPMATVIGMLSKYGCMVRFNCALCDFSAWVDLAINVAGAVAQKVSAGKNPQDVQSDLDKAWEQYVKEKQKSKMPFISKEKFALEIGYTSPPWINQATGEPISGQTLDTYVPDQSNIKTTMGYTYDIKTREVTNVRPPQVGYIQKHLDKWEVGDLSYPITSRPWKRFADQTIPTEIPNINSGNWIYDPYRSIEYAKDCFCIPPLVFNYQKEMQLKCLQQNCWSAHLSAGTSPIVCDDAFHERYCLYVKSAQATIHGKMDDFFDNLIDFLWGNLPDLVLSFVYSNTCSVYINAHPECSKPPVAGAYNWACGVLGAAMTWREVESAVNTNYGFNRYETYNKELLGSGDFCSGGGSLE
ncbi:hypothetical protein HYV84_06680 [Candidatus Woesearchaeota archaeon]|nr:hypothetical protein [Candidatus Woesearchaeota archaeon]